MSRCDQALEEVALAAALVDERLGGRRRPEPNAGADDEVIWVNDA